MTSNPITLDKEYQTRDGRPARVYATDIGGNSGGKSVLATYQLNGSTWVSIEYFANGRVNLGKESDLDLIEKPRTYKTGDFNTGYWSTGRWNTDNRNTGFGNTGILNTGNWNTGRYNTGRCNTGHYNTGYHNTGHWNTANNHVGCFNTLDPDKAYYFNKLIDKAKWDKAYKPAWLLTPSPTTWVPSNKMTYQEKSDNPSHKTTGGCLRVNDMKEEWRKAYQSASPEDIQAVRDLPAFDYDVFEESTGLDLRIKETSPCEGREIEIDGVTYVLKLKGQDDE